MTREEFKKNKSLKIQVITLSDRASRGEYEDLSGTEIVRQVSEYFSDKAWVYKVALEVIPDDAELLESKLIECRDNKIDFVFTSGGTGIGPRDFTPEVAKKLIEKEIPGIMENIRIKYGQQVPNALLSRGVAGVMQQTQLYCLPGSLKAVKEYMTEILKTLEHLIFMLYAVEAHQKH